MSRNATNGYRFSDAELVEIVATSTPRELLAAGWTLDHAAGYFAVGEVVYAPVRGALRACKVAKLGRTNLTVECTTPAAITEAARYGWDGPCLTSKVVKSTEVYRAPAVEAVEAAPASDAAVIDSAAVDELVAEIDTVLVEADRTLATVNREAWLEAAVAQLRPVFAERARIELPGRVRVSCGFPGGRSPAKTIGQCWYTATDKVAQLFVSPILEDAVDVLGVLVHELIHAWDGGKSGHKGAFTKVAKLVGLTGKMTATTVGDDLREILAGIAAELGPYPHARIELATLAGGAAKQTTRMLKVECPACGYTIRTTAKWLELGTPTCVCGEVMEAAG